jgi:hypothetical protein
MDKPRVRRFRGRTLANVSGSGRDGTDRGARPDIVPSDAVRCRVLKGGSGAAAAGACLTRAIRKHSLTVCLDLPS